MEKQFSQENFSSRHLTPSQFLSAESRLIQSKFRRFLHFLLTDLENEPIAEAPLDSIRSTTHLDETLLHFGRTATLKFRNYKLFRERVRSLFRDFFELFLNREHVTNRTE